MSTWRVKGFVQDSDEEDADVESCSTLSTNHSQHPAAAVDNLAALPEDHYDCPPADVVDHAITNKYGSSTCRTISPHARPKDERQTSHHEPPTVVQSLESEDAASQTRKVRRHNSVPTDLHVREPTDSPDPLHGSPTLQEKPADEHAWSSQILGMTKVTLANTHPNERKDKDTEAQNSTLPALSESDLSDPPSELEDLQPDEIIFHPPSRKTTVQVVIPCSASVPSLQMQSKEPYIERSFRRRKPIQLHPYLLEGERYRRDLQGRGLKPVARVLSPPRKSLHNEHESQEQEFDPGDEFTPSSPPEVLVSTPTVRQGAYTNIGSSARRKQHRLQNHDDSVSTRNGAKRRKKNSPSYTSRLQTGHSATEMYPSRMDVWAIPQSPPYSGSSESDARSDAGALAPMHVQDLPTPSNSSNLLPPRDVESDDDFILRTVQRHHQKTQRSIEPGYLSSSDTGSSGGDMQVSDRELQRVSKKIKGVLPASWLRLDRQAQATRNQDRPNNCETPNIAERQRGIAHKIIRPKDTSSAVDTLGHNGDVINISDDSDDSGDEVVARISDAQAKAHAASGNAVTNDRQYADYDSDDMENDDIHLFTLGGSERKQKIQTKLTNVFANSTRRQTFATRSRHAGKVSSKNPLGARKARRVSPPALSILDVEQSPASNHILPSFLRIAQRQARRRLDHARQSPTGKYIRLHTAQDTEDANKTLRQWRRGAIKPRKNGGKMLDRLPPRIPLSDLDRNHRDSFNKNDVLSAFNADSSSSMQNIRPVGRHIIPSKVSKRRNAAGPRHYNNPSFRTAQLECLAKEHGGRHSGYAFGHELRSMNRQFDLRHPIDQSFRDIQISRFLASEEAEHPSLPLVVESVEDQTAKALTPNAAVKKRRLRQKPQAHRVDVNTREYRQPSEPVMDSYLKTLSDLTGPAISQNGDSTSILQGLDLYGTRYSTTFDISPVHDGTYFQVSTFVGSGGLRRALAIAGPNPRNMDEPAGHCILDIKGVPIRCGPWENSVFTHFAHVASDICHAIFSIPEEHTQAGVPETCLSNTTEAIRSLVDYISIHLSFHDPIDRRSFVNRMEQWTSSVFESVTSKYLVALPVSPAKSLALLLVLCAQIREIAQHPSVEASVHAAINATMSKISKSLVGHILDHVSDLSDFLENNSRFHVRENGIRESDSLVESLVICMHVLQTANVPGATFWELVSQFLSTTARNLVQFAESEAVWGTLFTLLPFIEFDELGLPNRHRRLSFEQDHWNGVRVLLQRIFSLYSETSKRHSVSINAYIRAVLMRCHGLIHYWHWTRCEPILYSMFDFFVAKNGLQHLSREQSFNAAAFLEQIDDGSFSRLEPTDKPFHVFLKCLFVGIQGMRSRYTEKKLRSVVLRLIPNHGRRYPKDQPLEMEHLAALGNHHDIMCTLYRASPPPCRPKLDQIKALVEHGVSHREACRISIRAWVNLAAFQLSTDEPYENAQPFAQWHHEIMMQTLKQYRLAKTEAEEYMHSGALDDSESSSLMAKQFMEKNQNQVINALRDCVGGMRKVVTVCKSHNTLKAFLMDSNIVHLLELSHLQDQRLVIIIRDALEVLRAFANLSSQASEPLANTEQAEESQDYGEPLNLDDFMEMDQEAPQADSFLQTPLWRLLSNVFGAETTPDDNVLMDCVETWCLVARSQVSQGIHSWMFYLDSFSQVSWQQLRRTEQTQTFGPYFMASVLSCDSTAYAQHRITFLDACLTSLVDRDSMLKFQHRLLSAITRADPREPLLRNLPILADASTGVLAIDTNVIRTRRLGLISSILANMRDDFHRTVHDHPERVTEVRGTYAGMLKNLMSAMKNNYLQLNSGSGVTGAYVEFVQQVVQFLQQYTADIQPVIEFFTNSVAFPLPAADPSYVVGRLCGYASKLSRPGIAKQLSVFIQTVAQQAVTGNHQPYLVHQLQAALCTDTAHTRDRAALRDALLQGIFPAYVEAAFASPLGFVISQPILQSLATILQTLVYDIRIYDEANLHAVCDCLLAISSGFSSSVERLGENEEMLNLPYVLQALSYLFRIATPMMTLLQYMYSRCSQSSASPRLMLLFEKIALFVEERVHGSATSISPWYRDDFGATTPPTRYTELLSFSIEGLKSGIATNWRYENEQIYFGQGQAKREVLFEWGVADVRTAGLISALKCFITHVSRTGEEGRAVDMQMRDDNVGCIDV